VKPPVRVVLDTNVLLSAFFTRGVCEALFDACLESAGCVIVLSEHILGEFEEHAADKFDAPASDVRRMVEFLRANSEVVVPAPMPEGACPDPDDLPVLGTAVAGNAAALVTGDAELLAIKVVGEARILSPREMFDRMR
jgi:putative PIN family toxin of toxin-antitoxin system